MIKRLPTIRRGSGPRVCGFSIMELLLAIAIFAVGFSAVAAIFPVAALLQKQAVGDVLTSQVVRNIEAMAKGRPYPNGGASGLDQLMPLDLDVNPVMEFVALRTHYHIQDRSYPSVFESNRRLFYAVPVARRMAFDSLATLRTSAGQWQVFFFILSKEEETGYNIDGTQATFGYSRWANVEGDVIPAVFSMPVTTPGDNRFEFDNRQWPAQTPAGTADQVRPGDQVLDNNGIVYEVIDADDQGIYVKGIIVHNPATPNTIWYGRPPGPGKASPGSWIVGPLADVVIP